MYNDKLTTYVRVCSPVMQSNGRQVIEISIKIPRNITFYINDTTQNLQGYSF